MHIGYKYRVYPNKQQEEFLWQHFGACRYVYNLALETKSYAYRAHGKNFSTKELSKQLTDLKTEATWLHLVDSQVLQQVLIDLQSVYTKMYKGLAGYPKYRKRNSRHSFRSPKPERVIVDFENGTIKLPKFEFGIKTVFDRRFNGQVRSATVSCETTGKYYISLLIEDGMKAPKKLPIVADTAIGIDLGIKSFMVTSNGLTVDNPKHLTKSMKKLAYMQRKASRKKKGSKNRKKANRKIALQHEKVKFQRKDFLDKLSTWLVNNHDTICLETLMVKNMMKNHNLAQAISGVGWGMFVEMLEYKSERAGKNILRIGTFEPSSKMCGNCGDINKLLTIKDREWACASCGTLHDRDLNAAKNIKDIALKNAVAGRGTPKEPVELPTKVGAMKQEARCYQ